MCPDLPPDLNRLKEEEEQVPYNPPYEENQGDTHPKRVKAKVAQEHDYRESQEKRHPNLPDFVDDENPTGGVDLRGQAGEQGDDDLHGYREDSRDDEE